MLKAKFTLWQSFFIFACLLVAGSSLIFNNYHKTLNEINSYADQEVVLISNNPKEIEPESEEISSTEDKQANEEVLMDQEILTVTPNVSEIERISLSRIPTPEIVKGIYLTGYTFSNRARRHELISLINTTELNSMVIDINDPHGYFMFRPNDLNLKSIPLSKVFLENNVYQQALGELKDNGIYTIARVVTFEDDAAARKLTDRALKNKSGGLWTNYKDIAWLDMTNPRAWEIPVAKAKEAIELGFDEIQFDYIRFPSDGNMSQINYHDLPSNKYKYEILTNFFEYLSQELANIEIPISIDLFGLTYQIREDEHYDLNIGQRLVDSAKYFDYVSPMVYPSHYPSGYLGLSNPAAHPKIIIEKAMQDGNQILESIGKPLSKTRPWLQDFNMGATYNAEMVRAQIDAVENNHGSGWLLWNSRNVYTTGALKK